jgi:hypothetical protein
LDLKKLIKEVSVKMSRREFVLGAGASYCIFVGIKGFDLSTWVSVLGIVVLVAVIGEFVLFLKEEFGND